MLAKLRKIQDRRPESGFTIIEVMIVLAIAALILLIVFLAAPALERDSRNTARKSDAGRVASSLVNFISDNNGTLPTSTGTPDWDTAGATGSPPAECASVLSDAGTLSQYRGLTCAVTTQGNNSFDYENGAFTPATATANQLIYVVGGKCNTNVPGVTQIAGPRNSALLYDLETQTGNWNWTCIDVS